VVYRLLFFSHKFIHLCIYIKKWQTCRPPHAARKRILCGPQSIQARPTVLNFLWPASNLCDAISKADSLIELHAYHAGIIQKNSLNVSLLFFIISCFNIALNNFSCMVRMGFYYFCLLFVFVDKQFFSFLTGFIVWLKSCAARLLSGNWQSGPR